MIKDFLMTHRLAIFFLIFVGVVYLLPIAVLMPRALGSEYQGVLYLPHNNEDFYRARIHEILDGHWGVASHYLYEYKSAPPVVYPIQEWLYALPAYFIGLSNTIIASNFLLPATLFLLSYFLLFNVLGRREDGTAKLTALAGGLLITCGAEFVNYWYLLSLLQGGQVMPMMWTRIVNPIVGGVLLTLFLLLLWKVWEKKQRRMSLAAGVVLGGMVGYFFSFGLALAILATLFLFAILRKEYDSARSLLIVGAVSILVDAFWWFNMLATVGGEEGQARALLNGLRFTHEPVLNKAVLAATLITGAFFLYAYFYKRQREYIREYLFAFALLGGSWVAYNQQIITGREVWYYHFSQYTVPLAVFAVLIAGYFTLGKQRFFWSAAMIFLCAVSVVHGMFSVMSYEPDIAWQRHLQTYAPVLSWLEENAPKDCVVFTHPDASDTNRQEQQNLIPAYTSCNVYSIDWADGGVPPERALHNFLLRLQMSGISEANVDTYLREHHSYVRGSFYSDFDQAFGEGLEPWVLDRITSLTKHYGEFVKKGVEVNLKKYRVDYILSERVLSPEMQQELPGLSLATSTGTHYLYSVPAQDH